MSMSYLSVKNATATFLFIYLFAAALPVHALGVSPATVNANKVLKNSKLKKSVNITRSNPARDEVFAVSVGKEGARYIELTSNEFKLPKGATQVPFDFYIAPKNAQNGSYVAEIYFEPKIEEGNSKEQTGLSVLLGAQIIVKFSVSDEQVIAGSVLSARISNLEVGEEQKVAITAEFKNDSNVDTAPDKYVLTVLNNLNKTVVDKQEGKIENISLVEPGGREEVTFETPVSLPLGTYKGDIEYFIGETSVGTTNGLPFRVLPVGALSEKLEFETFEFTPTRADAVGTPIRFDARVRNTGQSSYSAQLHVELIKDEQVIQSFDSEKRVMVPGRGGVLTITQPVNESGIYKVRAFVDYGFNRSEEKIGELKVDGSWLLRIISGAVVLGAIGFLAYRFKRGNIISLFHGR